MDNPKSYKGNQILLTSDRLVLNAKNDAVLIFASKAIGISSSGTVNIDSDDYTIINSPKIYLGLKAKDEKEPLLLGNKSTQLIKDLIKSIQSFCKAAAKPTPTIPGAPLVDINIAATILDTELNIIISELNNIKSKQNFTI